MYIVTSDIENHIEQGLLAALTFNDPDTNTPIVISQAISQLRSYLLARYQIDLELAKTGADRDSLIVMLCLDLVVYHLFTLVDAAHIPIARADRYKAALDFLKDAQSGLSVLNIPVVTDDTKFEVKGGSNAKRVNQY